MDKFLRATINIYGTTKWATLKTWRRRQLKKIFPNGKVSPNFRHIEFWTKDGTPIPIRAVPALRFMCKHILESMRAKFGPCIVHSGYRHYYYNLAIGGAGQSEHVWDDDPKSIAVDMSFAQGTPQAWAEEAARLMATNHLGGGIGLYEQNDAWFVHVDNRVSRARWFGKKTKVRDVKW